MSKDREQQSIKLYLDEVGRNIRLGDATEHTHRPALKSLVEDICPDLIATNEPRRIACGAPDFAVRRSTRLIQGYIEAKDVGQSLDRAADSEQLSRYRKSLKNLILTDYLEFRWYVNGEMRAAARLATVAGDRLRHSPDGKALLAKMLGDFAAFSPPPIEDATTMAEHMARIARTIRDTVEQAFNVGESSQTLRDLRKVVADVLVAGMDSEENLRDFADMYAQTLVYGYFIARCNHKGPEPFVRQGASAEIGRTNPFLRKLMEVMTGGELNDEPYIDFVDDLVAALAACRISKVLASFDVAGRAQDPVIHFYEEFLAAYDAEIRENRGVYYTPFPVVKFIVDSIHASLQLSFGLPAGLADASTTTFDVKQFADAEGNIFPDGPKTIQHTSPKVLILDPACGTGTFLYAVIHRLREQFRMRKMGGMWQSFVGEQLLPRLFGFELLMAPYAVAHLKLAMQLSAQDMSPDDRSTWRYELADGERFGVFLTNTLDRPETEFATLYGQLRAVAEEATEASRIKRDLPIMVILGNPPWQGESFNKGDFAKELVSAYQQIDGKPLDERQQKWLHDDYVKFIRWSEAKIEKTGSGIVGFVTNHKYIDNVTFRAMRKHLLDVFDEIYILDLHGNSKSREVPHGTVDQNVFDVQQGSAISIFVKHRGSDSRCKVFHADLWGTRKEKYDFLNKKSIQTIEWKEIKPSGPNFFFKPVDEATQNRFQAGWLLDQAMPEKSVGIISARDKTCFQFTKGEIRRVLDDFTTLPEEKLRDRFSLGKDVRDWKVASAKADVVEAKARDEYIVRAMYRPFDDRFTFYTGKSKGFLGQPQARIMSHLIGHPGNMAIGTTRSCEIGRGWEHVFVTNQPAQHHAISIKEANYFFPLYLHLASAPGAAAKAKSRQKQEKLFGDASWSRDETRPNFDPKFVREFEENLDLSFKPIGKGDLGETFGAEDLFAYIYAILHAPAYRREFRAPLKSSYPRIPCCKNREQFAELVAQGHELIGLHLLKDPRLGNSPISFPEAGDAGVKSREVRFESIPEETSGKVFVNKTQYFGGVSTRAWETHVGGYKVMEKWLKDRHDRRLTHNDLEKYQSMAYALDLAADVVDRAEAALGRNSLW